MSPELVIAVVIFVLGCAQTVCWRFGWGLPRLFLMVLEVQARAARDRARARERRLAAACCPLCESAVHAAHVREDMELRAVRFMTGSDHVPRLSVQTRGMADLTECDQS